MPELGSRPEYNPFFYAMTEHPLYKQAITVNLESCEEEGMYGVSVFDFDSRPNSSDFGVFGVFGRPAFEALTEWIAASPVESAPIGI